MATVIKVDHLYKSYRIGHLKRERYETLRDVLAHKARGMAQRFRHPLSPNRESVQLEEFWALKGINLEIEQGERVGIIGRNGAGKSTLLKILSRITEPTKGGFMIKGRVASLLEVGTGFHPELSGRENIYLNGAVLGMTKKEIKQRFDEIVDFAEVETFLDTPVKRYSSGMYVRLAFAVAAHLEPEILMVDEVLAVGDLNFQQKCIGKMNEIGNEGRTILVVSHNMRVVEKLTERCLYLKSGRVAADGSVFEIIEQYQKETIDKSKSVLPFEFANICNINRVKISNAVMICEVMNQSSYSFRPGDAMTIRLNLEAEEDVNDVVICARIYRDDFVISGNNSEHTLGRVDLKKNVRKQLTINFEGLMLLPGNYRFIVFVLPSYFSPVKDAISNIFSLEFVICGASEYGGGCVYLKQSWSTD